MHGIQRLGWFCSFSHDLWFSKPHQKGGTTLRIHSIGSQSHFAETHFADIAFYGITK